MLTHSITLYLATVLIWGSTFYAIKFQLGDVPEPVMRVLPLEEDLLGLHGLVAVAGGYQ